MFDIIDIKRRAPMTDLLIRNIPIELKDRIEKQARADHVSLSDAAKSLIEKGFNSSGPRRLLGTEMFDLLEPEFRTDDLMFEIPGQADEPPDFS
jgi:hypothetical protein